MADAMSLRPTGRQVEYALALGIALWPEITRAEISGLFDRAKADLDGPPTPEQHALAAALCIRIPQENDTRRRCTNFLYEYIAARRWVFSVIRHVFGAKWRLYAQSGLPEEWAAQIAVAILQDEELFGQVLGKPTGNSETGADVWTRMSKKPRATPAYQFVCNFELPETIAERIRQAAIEPATFSPSKAPGGRRKSSGCAIVIVVMVAVVSAAALLA